MFRLFFILIHIKSIFHKCCGKMFVCLCGQCHIMRSCKEMCVEDIQLIFKPVLSIHTIWLPFFHIIIVNTTSGRTNANPYVIVFVLVFVCASTSKNATYKFCYERTLCASQRYAKTHSHSIPFFRIQKKIANVKNKRTIHVAVR